MVADVTSTGMNRINPDGTVSKYVGETGKTCDACRMQQNRESCHAVRWGGRLVRQGENPGLDPGFPAVN